MTDEDHRAVEVVPDTKFEAINTPVNLVKVSVGTAAVYVRVVDDVAELVGGQSELSLLLQQMRQMIDRGSVHWEILRVLDQGYEHIHPSTHIDLIVVAAESL